MGFRCDANDNSATIRIFGIVSPPSNAIYDGTRPLAPPSAGRALPTIVIRVSTAAAAAAGYFLRVLLIRCGGISRAGREKRLRVF